MPVQRLVALLAGLQDDRIVPRASFFQLRLVREARGGWGPAAGHRPRGRACAAEAVTAAGCCCGTVQRQCHPSRPDGALRRPPASPPREAPKRHPATPGATWHGFPAPNLAAAGSGVGSGGGELDFDGASRCPPAHEADSKPVDGLPPEVLEVIAVAAEIALQHRHVRHAA